MTDLIINRRATLRLGGATLAALSVPVGTATSARSGPGGLLFFEPSSAVARAEAKATKGRRLVALGGDPVCHWRDSPRSRQDGVHGVTRWSDYLVLRGLAEEEGYRVAREERRETMGGPMIVSWSMA